MTEWRETTLGKLCNFQAGDAFATDRQGAQVGQVPFIKVSDMNLVGNEYYISRANNWLSEIESQNYRVHRPGASVFAKIGEALRANRRRLLSRPTIIDNNMMSATALEGVNDRWLYYLLQTVDFNTISRGSALPYLTVSDLKKIPALLPCDQVQLAIAEALGALDDKIELNRRMNETLEAMARSVFRDWFLDFGPTRRKAAGITDPTAILGGLIPDPAKATPLATLFPASFAENGLPEGWEERPLDEIADFLNGLALQKYPARVGEPSLPVIKIAELRGGVTTKSDRASRDLPEKYIINDGDFIFSWSGSLLAKFWSEGEGALNQHLFKVSSGTYSTWFFSQWVHHHLEDFQRIAASKATTMGHIQRGHLKAAMTVDPGMPILEEMGVVMGPMLDLAIQNSLENQTLAATRDLLLPKLMSGEFRLKDPEAAP